MKAPSARKSCLASPAVLAATGCGTAESSHPAPEQTLLRTIAVHGAGGDEGEDNVQLDLA
jgi:hypothetical protein